MISSLTELFLADAVYFKGRWDEPFDAKSTKDRVFHLRGGKQKHLPMMEQTRKFDYRGVGPATRRCAWSTRVGPLGCMCFYPIPGPAPRSW